ncbi:MAG: hypothetical protein BJ554DRAFT_6181 [Olpidium bornovanus]|uniref:Uncharacterized protein n=1 Tax=Olpidium bornovanus TaxID=278681 RepID=A0A8H8DKX0_9FUNG|nr:MAG: hypothetical protein BJ554DRAFT_6181 [Olpidium bornovanus]
MWTSSHETNQPTLPGLLAASGIKRGPGEQRSWGGRTAAPAFANESHHTNSLTDAAHLPAAARFKVASGSGSSKSGVTPGRRRSPPWLRVRPVPMLHSWPPGAVLRGTALLPLGKNPPGVVATRAAQPTFALPLTTVAATPCAAGGAQFTVSRIGTDDELTITDQAAKVGGAEFGTFQVFFPDQCGALKDSQLSGRFSRTSASLTARHRYLAEKEGAPDQALRITVESGGCHGFQYRLELTTKLEKDDVWVLNCRARPPFTCFRCTKCAAHVYLLTIWRC